MERRLFGTNGIRGVVNQDLTSEFVVKMGLAIGTFFNGGQLLIGCDGRTSSQLFKEAMISGLVSTGCSVHDVGCAPTPAIQFLTKHFELDGSVTITASHNPPEYNGIKVNSSDGIEIPREDEVKIEQNYFNETFRQVPWNLLGKVYERKHVLNIYLDAIKRHVDVGAIKKEHYRIVVDPGNGVGTITTPYLLRELGCEVITINSNLDGRFPSRLPEPALENLKDLASTVKAVKADMGVAHDGDADRSIFCDETGTLHWGDKSGAIIQKYILKKHPGATIVTPVSSSKLVEDIAERYGGKIVWTKVGSIIVSRKMLEVGSIFSYEENGGIFYAPHLPVRDGGISAALMLEIMAKTGKTLSQLVNELPKYYAVKAKIKCSNDLKPKVLDRLLEETSKYERLTLDGVKLFIDNGSILIRPSGTEPIFRVFSEAKTEAKAKSLSEFGMKIVRDLIKKSQ